MRVLPALCAGAVAALREWTVGSQTIGKPWCLRRGGSGGNKQGLRCKVGWEALRSPARERGQDTDYCPSLGVGARVPRTGSWLRGAEGAAETAQTHSHGSGPPRRGRPGPCMVQSLTARAGSSPRRWAPALRAVDPSAADCAFVRRRQRPPCVRRGPRVRTPAPGPPPAGGLSWEVWPGPVHARK